MALSSGAPGPDWFALSVEGQTIQVKLALSQQLHADDRSNDAIRRVSVRCLI
jgi:hypothetical protein